MKTCTRAIEAFLIMLGAASIAAAEPANPATGAGGRAAAVCPCCKESDAAAYSKESIYQMDGRFQDDGGRDFVLGSLRGRPVVIDMFFASCGYACPLTVTDMLAIQGRLPAEVRARAVFVLVSFDCGRDTPSALAKYRAQRALDGQWVLLHGDDGTVRELAALLGVSYRREADGSFTHSNVLSVLNRQGELSYRRIGLSGGVSELGAAVVAAGR